MIVAPNRELIFIDGFPIYWYGVVISLAVIICYILIPKIIRNNRTIDKYQQWYGLIIISGFVGARLFEVFFYSPEYFLSNPWEIINTRLGGLSIFGGILGVGTILFLLKDQFKGKWLSIVDVSAILAPLGQAIGRWGNFFNQELYGLPCSHWWCLQIDVENRLPGWQEFTGFQPTFFYESILLLALFVFLWRQKKEIGKGLVVSYYLLGYGVIRFLVEFVRIDVRAIGWFKWPQLVALLFFLVGLFLYIRFKKKGYSANLI